MYERLKVIPQQLVLLDKNKKNTLKGRLKQTLSKQSSHITGNSTKSDKMLFLVIKNFLRSKGHNYQNKDTVHRVG